MEVTNGTVANAAANVAAQVPPPPPQSNALDFAWWLFVVLALLMLFVVEFVRAMPWTKTALASKPLSCDACMVGWTGIAFILVQRVAFGGDALPLVFLHTLPAMGGTLLLLALKSYWKPQFPTES